MANIWRNKNLINGIKTLLIFGISSATSIMISYLGVGKESIIMVFLLGVLFSTVLTSSYVWGIASSIASLMLVNFLFTEPRFTFVIYDSNDIILLAFFLITAGVSGKITSRLQNQIELTGKNERTTHILYRIASGFIPISGKKSIVKRGISFVEEFTNFNCSINLVDENIIQEEQNSEESCCDFDILSNTGKLGVLRVHGNSKVDDGQSKIIIQSIATQMGIALEREQLNTEREKIKVAMEREQLRATLLRSVSHDLRSPLTALSGAGNLLYDKYYSLSDEERRSLAGDISEEITWLTNLVENILNMTRINESQLLLKKEEEVVDDVVSEAVAHTRRIMKDRKFTIRLPKDVIAVPMDGKLIVQVLVNLLENAVRHTPADSEILLEADVEDRQFKIIISDSGEGINESIKGSLFDRFVTLETGIIDGKRGIGLGLTICKAIIEAHGGVIYTEPNQPKGSRFVFKLPMEDHNGKSA